MLTTILTRYEHKTCFSSDSPLARNPEFNLNDMLLYLDEWEPLLHMAAQGIRQTVLPESQRDEPVIVNKISHPIDELDIKRLMSTYVVLWQTADPEDDFVGNEIAHESMARTAYFLSQNFKDFSRQIIFDYSDHTITVE